MNKPMTIRKKIKQLFIYHNTTRLLINDLEQRHIELLGRVQKLEEKVFDVSQAN
jgi:hypothetical protein